MEDQIKQILLQAQLLQQEVDLLINDNKQLQEQQQQDQLLYFQDEFQQEGQQERLLKSTLLFDSGDTAWMMFATILVFMMTTPGIMLYYGGLVRVENVLATAMQGFSIACLITFLWLCFGYSLSFAPVNNSLDSTVLFGNTERFWLLGLKPTTSHQVAPHIPESLFCAFELAFAIITPSLICGAFADRMKFSSMLVVLGLWHFIVYCPIAHSHWHPDGFLHKAGVIDYAGGNVVHVSAGFSSLVAAIMIGQRSGRKENYHPHNLLVSITGACFLWLGWYGFNAGSGFHADKAAGIAMLNTMIASGVASITWMMVDLLFTGRPSIIGIMNGAIAGLVTITPAAGYVPISGAFVIGLIGGFGVSRGVLVKEIFGFDDALDAFGVHAIGGVIGSFMVGLFAKEEIGGHNGAFYGDPKQLGLQVYSIVVTAGWASVGTGIIMYIIDKLIGLRVSAKTEKIGLDRSLHGSQMYSQITDVSDRRKDVEETRKMTVLRRIREMRAAQDNALDAMEERVVRVRGVGAGGSNYSSDSRGNLELTDRENGSSYGEDNNNSNSNNININNNEHKSNKDDNENEIVMNGNGDHGDNFHDTENGYGEIIQHDLHDKI